MRRMGRVVRRSSAAVAGGALALAVGIAGSSPARAACTPSSGDASTLGVTAICSGSTFDQGGGAPGTSSGSSGYGDREDNVTVNVLSGATVTGTDFGIWLRSDATIHNFGSITGGAHGIRADTITSLSNSGSISGGSNNGISSIGPLGIGTLTNSGSITGGINGISAITIGSLTNSGLIAGGGLLDYAIQIASGDTQLTLLAGSVLVGLVDHGGASTLNVGKGLSMVTTITTVGTPLQIGSMNVPFVTSPSPLGGSGGTVITADTTGLANHSTMVADLTGGIFSTVENRMDNLRSGVSSFAQPMVMAHAADASASGPFARFGAGGVDRSRQVWMQAFGSHRQQEGTSRTLDSQHRLGGFVSGMDIGSGPNRAGIFFGGSVAASQIDANAGKTSADSFFGGAYASTQANGTFVDLAFTAGYSSFDRERRVANNQVIGGIETAKADHHGWFVSPEVRFMRPVAFGAQPLEASLTLRYAGLFLDGFAETGSSGNLTVGSRGIHLGTARAALALPLTKNYSDGAQARWIWTAGIEGRTQFGGDNVSGALAGQDIAFSAGGRQSTAGLFGSYRAELASPLGHTVYAVAEGIAEQDGSYQLSAKAGFRVRY